MSAGYGIGLLTLLGEVDSIEVLTRVVEQSGVPRLRERVGERVIELISRGGQVEHRWLSADEAAPILNCQRHWREAADYAEAIRIADEETELALPGPTHNRLGPARFAKGWLELPDRRRLYVSLDQLAPRLEEKLAEEELDPGVAATLTRAQTMVTACREHSLAFHIYFPG